MVALRTAASCPHSSVAVMVLISPAKGSRTSHLTSPSVRASVHRSSGDLPGPRQHPFRLGIALSGRLWIPGAFRLPAFASLTIPIPLEGSAFLTVGVPAYRPPPDSIGVATFHMSEIRPGWVPSLLRGRGVRMPSVLGGSTYTSHWGLLSHGPRHRLDQPSVR